MPISSIKRMVHAALRGWGAVGSVGINSIEAMKLVDLVAERFGVSIDATQVRLSKLGFLTEGVQSSSVPLI